MKEKQRGIAMNARMDSALDVFQGSIRRRKGWFSVAVILTLGLWLIGLPLLLLAHNQLIGAIIGLCTFTALGPGVLFVPVLKDFFLETEMLDRADRRRERAEARQEEREARRHGHDPRKDERLREQGAAFYVGSDGEIVFEKTKKHPEDPNRN